MMGTSGYVRRGLRGLIAVALAAGLLAAVSAPSRAAASVAAVESGRRSYTGTIDGAEYRVEMPKRWNGTLVMYSHGYYPEGVFPVEEVAVSNTAETGEWLLAHGFALAASNFKGTYGFQVDQGQRDQLALLDWFESNIGRPDRTISTGQSLGVPIAVLLAERHPDRFDGVMNLCGVYDTQGNFNAGLDMTYAVRTLLTDPDEPIDLVRPRDHEAGTTALVEAIDAAVADPQGRARLALVAALNNVTGWWSALAPPPASDEERIRNQSNWIRNAYVAGSSGPTARADLEPKVGGNPSFNIGIDYRRQLARSSQLELVERAYRDAGLDLDADVAKLNGGSRIAPDLDAVRYMYRTSVPRGRTPVPVVSLHSTGDGGVVPDHERWYAEQVRRNGHPSRLRQLYVDRGQHCSFSAADEVTALNTLLHRIENGRWPSTSPRRLNAAVSQFDPHFQQVLDLGNYPDKEVMPPAFTRFTPPRFLRPSR